MFDYSIRSSKRSKNLRLTIKSNGQVIVTKPYYLPQMFAKSFVISQKDWIESQLEKIKPVSSQIKFIYYQGTKYQISFNKARFSYHFKNQILYLTGPSFGLAKSNLKKILIAESKKLIKDSVKNQAQLMDLSYGQIRIKDQSTRWGSCSSQKNLNFNWRLIQAPLSILNYVVIHELAHLKYLNHSRYFWQYLEKFDPDYRHHRRWLKNNGYLLHQF